MRQPLAVHGFERHRRCAAEIGRATASGAGDAGKSLRICPGPVEAPEVSPAHPYRPLDQSVEPESEAR